MFYIFDIPRGKGFNEFRLNLTGGEGESTKYNFEGEI